MKHLRLNTVPGNLVRELLKRADLTMIHGPNTSDTRANPPLAMFVADIAR